MATDHGFFETAERHVSKGIRDLVGPDKVFQDGGSGCFKKGDAGGDQLMIFSRLLFDVVSLG